MPNFIGLFGQSSNLIIYVCIAVAVMLAVEGLGLFLARKHSYRSRINRRLQLLDAADDRRAALIELRRDRGLSDEGHYTVPFISINRLVLQSGIGWRSGGMVAIVSLAFSVAAFAGYAIAQSMLVALLIGILAGIVVPILFLLALRSRRRAKFAAQLPEALDIIVRSLRAGHPIPVAISLVAREMPDPIGTEFGMASDEMVYGMDLEATLQNLRARVGLQDLSFVEVAVSIQSKTGGNLSEVLSNLSKVIRDRFKLRRRVKAMSAEGRLSAIALSAIPILVFLMVNFMAPNFYGDVKGDPLIVPVFVATLFVWAAGVFIIYRLVNFKY
jgi:tight adherence protein B